MEKSMHENLVGYLLGCLDDKCRLEVEGYLRAHPERRRLVGQLGEVLKPLAADKTQPDPPRDLVVRTLGRVAEACVRSLPRAPLPTPGHIGSGRSF